MEGLGPARNISIKEFEYISDYEEWKKNYPQYFIYDIQIVRISQYDYKFFVIYRTINK